MPPSDKAELSFGSPFPKIHCIGCGLSNIRIQIIIIGGIFYNVINPNRQAKRRVDFQRTGSKFRAPTR
jgi:hypothetical protein